MVDILMNTYGLQQELITEIENILSGMELKNAAGEKTKIKGYDQWLPKTTEYETDRSQFFPFFTVALQNGETSDDEDDLWHVGVIIYLAVFNDSLDNNGHHELLSMIQKITDRFLENRCLNYAYNAEPKMGWEILDEDTYPYYYGDVQMTFTVPKQGRSNEFA